MKNLAAKLVALALLMAPLPAVAQTTKTNIISDINTMFADNTSNLITALMLRTVTTEMVSSYVDWLTCSTSPTAGSIIYYQNGGIPVCLPFGTTGQYLRAGSVSPSWQSLGSNLTAGTGIGISGAITPTIAVSDVALNGLQGLSSVGFTALTATGTPDVFASRTISGGTGITITNPAGTAGDPVVVMNDQIIAAGPIGSSTIVPSITYNARGQLTAVASNTISASTLLDVIGSAQGDLLYRSATGWAVLTPGTSGQVLTTQGAANNPAFTTVAGTGTVQTVTCGLGLTCTPNPITTTGTITPTVATSPQFVAGTANKLLDANSVFTQEAQKTATGATTLDFSTFISMAITMTTSITSVTCSNIKAGQAGIIRYIQNGASATTTVWCSAFKWAGGTAPSLSTIVTATDALVYGPCTTSSYCVTSLIKDVR